MDKKKNEEIQNIKWEKKFLTYYFTSLYSTKTLLIKATYFGMVALINKNSFYSITIKNEAAISVAPPAPANFPSFGFVGS